MPARDEAHESVNPSAQGGGATPSEEEIGRIGGWSATAGEGIVPAEGGESDAPDEMTDDDHEEPELTREGLLGALAGKAKEAVGELVGNEDLARAGRVQQAEINADAEAS